MAKTSGGWISAEEHAKQLQADPEFMRMRAEQERVLAEREGQLKFAEAPLVEDLCRLGFRIESIWFLRSHYRDYTEAIPLLLDHLQKPYPDVIRAGIAQALGVRAARKIGWSLLVDEFRKADSSSKQVKESLAAALAGASDDSVIKELIDLAKDKSHGASRILLLRGIKKSKRPEAKFAIDELANDPELSKEIKSWQRNRK